MTDLRPLPICLPPADGEAFASWLDRVGADLEVPLMTLLVAIGFAPEPHFRMVPSGYGVSLTAEQLTDISHATGCSPDEVAATLLNSYDGKVFDLNGIDLETELGLRVLGVSKWVYASRTRFCPHCLIERDGAWELSWKLPWAFACVRHSCLLEDTCPGCGRFPRGQEGTLSGSKSPTAVPTPTHCSGAPLPGAARCRRLDSCRFDLTASKPPSLAGWTGLLQSQRHIEELVAGKAYTVGGNRVSSVTLFSDLRVLIALVMQCGQVDDLGEVPDLCRAAFESVIERRSEARSNAAAVRSATSGPRRFFVRGPREPALMAGLVPLAQQMIDAPTSAALAERISWLAERIRSARPVRPETLCGRFGASAALVEAFEAVASPPATFVLRAGIFAPTPPERRTFFDLDPDYIPALYWADRYEAHFADVLSPMTERSGRRLCAVALVKGSGRYTWQEAVAMLGYPLDGYANFAGNAISRLQRAGAGERFWKVLQEEAAALAEEGGQVNWGWRRRALTDLRAIDVDVWMRLCMMARVPPGWDAGTKRRNAAAWLWAELTGGDPRLAPVPIAWGDNRNPVSYRFFITTQLPPLREILLEYGNELLAAADSESTATTERRSA